MEENEIMMTLELLYRSVESETFGVLFELRDEISSCTLFMMHEHARAMPDIRYMSTGLIWCGRMAQAWTDGSGGARCGARKLSFHRLQLRQFWKYDSPQTSFV